MPFDTQSTAVLLRLRNEDVEAVIATAKPTHGAHDVLAFYDYLYDLGFFDIRGRLAADVLDVQIPKDHLVAPLAVHLEVVSACNLTCKHCFAGVLPRHTNRLTLDELNDLFATLASIGSFRLGITGGEPLLRPDLFEILDLSVAHGLCPCLTTNATLITEEIAMEFGRRDLVWLNISLDGATRQTNDAIRGQGTFDQVCDRIRLLSKHSRFTLAFTITSLSVEEVNECARLSRQLGAHTAVFRPLYPVGTAASHLQLMPTYRQYVDALDGLRRVADSESFETCAMDPFSPESRRTSQARVYTNNGCGAGNLVCSISVDGNVNPCSFLGSSFESGNIRERPFVEIWNEGEQFRRMRATVDSADGGFEGGCRARAMVLGGNVDAADPWYDEFVQNGAVRVPDSANSHPMSNVELLAPTSGFGGLSLPVVSRP